jgi:hypothetical protein
MGNAGKPNSVLAALCPNQANYLISTNAKKEQKIFPLSLGKLWLAPLSNSPI